MDVTLRKKQERDNQFVFELFFSHKVKELKAETWPDTMKHQMCLMQFNAFEKSLTGKGINIRDFIITGDTKPAGRLILNESNKSILIELISVLPDYQNKGIGKKVLQTIIKDATESNKELCLSVAKNNNAYFLYLKLGFVVTGEDDLKYLMTYGPL